MNATEDRGDEAPPGRPLGVDPTEPSATQSMRAAMVGNAEGWFNYYFPVNLADAGEVENLVDMLGRVPDRRPIELPPEPGIYYFFSIKAADGNLLPILLPEGRVTAWVFGVASTIGRDAVEKVQFATGIVPA